MSPNQTQRESNTSRNDVVIKSHVRWMEPSESIGIQQRVAFLCIRSTYVTDTGRKISK